MGMLLHRHLNRNNKTADAVEKHDAENKPEEVTAKAENVPVKRIRKREK